MQTSTIEMLILTIVLIAGIVGFAVPTAKRLKLVGTARGGFSTDQVGRRIGRFISEVLFQSIVIKQRPFAGFMHALVFWGFLAFIPETLDHFAHGYGFSLLGHGTIKWIIQLIVTIMAVLVSVGITALAIRRFIFRPKGLGKLHAESGIIALLILILMVTYLLGVFGLDRTTLAGQVNWWIHAVSIPLFAVIIPNSKHMHLVLSPFTTFLKSFRLADIRPVDFEADDLEIGVEKLSDFSAHSVLGAFSCVECGRCQDHCPAFNTGKLLNPKALMLDMKDALLADPSQPALKSESTGAIDETVIWQCTTCGACTYQCPVGIDQVVPLIEMRRARVAEGTVPHTFGTFFNNLETRQNPWAYPPNEAQTFLTENNYPAYDGQEYLYWMGCLARFDQRYRKVSLAFTKLLNAAGVSWGVMYEEQCTGDAARRAGNEYLFTELAMANVEALNATGAKKIVTTCPHCRWTLNEYKDFNLKKDITIVHHTELLRDLARAGKIPGAGNGGMSPSDSAAGVADADGIVYHDPCYLSRYGDTADIDNPRQLVQIGTGKAPQDPPRSRDKSFCCGAGGAMIFAEETEGTRINRDRTQELLDTGAKTIAVACPFCQIMVSDGANDLGHPDTPVLDVAQVLAEKLGL